ncbi:unnamed protein product [Blepharisma stoltei]|uniref:Uncharacterized protein n=1 Tax=Blepharisma stoltei TaxID=1481888 RepID=A0AAU9JRE9_9CILI|nr:unnamed protein product [Blepharisma stoltei]
MNETKLEEKIASLRATLNKLGTSLVEEDYTIDEDLNDSRLSDALPSNLKGVSFRSESLYSEEANTSPKSDVRELRMLLDYERKRSENLENRIASKDQLLGEMSALQNELYANIEDLQNKLEQKQPDVQRENEYIASIKEGYVKEVELMNEQLHQKSHEILNLNFMIEQANFKEKEYLAQISDLKIQIEMKAGYENLDAIYELRKQIQDQNAEILKLNKEKEEYQFSQDSFRTNDAISMRKEISVLMKTVDELHIINQEKEKIIEELKKEINELNNQIFEEKEKNREQSYINERTVKAQYEYNKSANEIEALKEKLDELSEKMNNKSFKCEICEDLSLTLGVSDPKKIYPKITQMLKDIEKQKQINELYQKVENLIIQFSPEGAFVNAPTPHQIWRWLIRLFEEYMALKKSVDGQFLERVYNILKVKDPNAALQAIESFVKKI